MAKVRYASMPDWLYRTLKITPAMDRECFRMHDHDYGRAGYTVLRWTRAETRAEADENLRIRLIAYGLPKSSAFLVWLGCRLLKSNKWRK